MSSPASETRGPSEPPIPPSIHLVCNAHIDPVWLWEWEEGAAVALATFRTAAQLCEEFPAFVFCHNEAILYEHVEEYDPPLFARIRRLVQQGRWHVMGGWYLQPDCNMPSGESFVRQILLGKRYFRAKLGVDVRTAVNLDPFGHSRGLVQVLARSGYDSYLFCRPDAPACPLPDDAFTWVGYDGSTVIATRASSHYNSPPGGARRKVEEWIAAHPDRACSIVPWGVGNHGGGPSRRDLRELETLMAGQPGFVVAHSTPERYFADLRARGGARVRHAGDLNPWAVGCYTSMHRVKQEHRRLEDELRLVEKMASAAILAGRLVAPRAELREAGRDLAACQFHDALPGTSIEPVEQALLRRLGHGREILGRVRARAFFALAAGQRPAREGELPILVYNAHPWPVTATIECELQPPWPHGTDGFLLPSVRRGGRSVPCQTERELSNLAEDHRKRVVFRADLEPARMNRFDCRLDMTFAAPRRELREREGRIRFRTDELEVVVSGSTGLVDRYRVRGVDFFRPNAFRPLLRRDDADPWAMRVRRFRTPAGRFRLMAREAGTAISGVSAGTLGSVRILEDGPIRSVVEALLAHGRSVVRLRYALPRRGTEIGVEARVYWAEQDRMLKLSIPTTMRHGSVLGQAVFGVADLAANGDEVVAQRWVAMVDREQDRALTVANDGVYGLDAARGELRLSLLRAPAHSGHPARRPAITPQDRHTPRIDQGEHTFRFWIDAGPYLDRLNRIDREATAHSEPPFALACAPSGEGELPPPGVLLSDDAVQLAACKPAEDGDDLVLRLFEPTGRRRSTTVTIPAAEASARVTLAPFEIRTLRFRRRDSTFVPVDLLEEPVGEG
ncbi:MAG: glycoside hydrolase family 38 C-terminal domain-containing protein [Planctomycetota bacterium]